MWGKNTDVTGKDTSSTSFNALLPKSDSLFLDSKGTALNMLRSSRKFAVLYVYKNGKCSSWQRTLSRITPHNAAHPCISTGHTAESVQMLRAAGRRHNESVNGTNEPTDQIHYQLMQSTWLIGKQLGLLCIFTRSSQSEELTSLRSTSGCESMRQSDDRRLPGAKDSSSMGPCVWDWINTENTIFKMDILSFRGQRTEPNTTAPN